jgi:hypothetical protein
MVGNLAERSRELSDRVPQEANLPLELLEGRRLRGGAS